jgi:hypothetical protein
MQLKTKLAVFGVSLLSVGGGTALLIPGASAATRAQVTPAAPTAPAAPAEPKASEAPGAPEAPESNAPESATDTHNDGAGNVDHQCPPACAAGEQG